MRVKNTVKLPTSEMLISMTKSNIISNGFLTEAEISELIFTIVDGQMKVDGPQTTLNKLPRSFN